MERSLIKASKFLSLLLRHRPGAIGLELDEEGWASVDDLIEKSRKSKISFSRDMIRTIVAQDDKQRYAFDAAETRVRANQGHSIDINLKLEPKEPPVLLYHGTASKNKESIFASGLIKRNRQHVHLSKDAATAKMVGQRHGKPIIFLVDSKQMHDDGYLFYQSKNGVWLTETVPSQYLTPQGF